jgi:hypothetical protein
MGAGSVSTEPAAEVRPGGFSDQDQAAMLNLLFGKAAPLAEKGIRFLSTPSGQQVLGVTGVAAAALVLPRVIR